MNPEEGTIEFWLKTNWDQTLVPHGVQGTLIQLEADKGAFHSSYYRGLTSLMTPYYDIRGTHYGVGGKPLSGPQGKRPTLVGRIGGYTSHRSGTRRAVASIGGSSSTASIATRGD